MRAKNAIKDKKGAGKVKEDEDAPPIDLITRPKEYVVKFTFPNPSELAPPILGIHGKPLLQCKNSLYLCPCLAQFWGLFVVVHVSPS